MKLKAILLTAFGSLIIAAAAFSQSVPGKIGYQGRLFDSSGAPLTAATVDMSFAIYASQSGGTLLWSETQEDVAVTNGLYEVNLGDASSLSSPVFSSGKAWLEVAVDGETLSPRQPMVTAPYAFSAAGLAGDDYVLNSGDTVTGDLELHGALLVNHQAGGSFGILYSNTNVPTYGAYVTGDQFALYGVNQGATDSTVGALAMPISGVYGQAGNTAATSTRIGGDFSASSSATAIGASASSSAHGASPSRAVMGIAHNYGTGDAAGGYFLAWDDGSGTRYGVYGRAMGEDGTHYGVYGSVDSPDAYGVFSNGNAFVEGGLGVSAISQDRRTKKQIGALKWHEANLVTSASPGGGYFAAAYDGANSVALTQFTGNGAYKTTLDMATGGLIGGVGNNLTGIACDGQYFWAAARSSNYIRNITTGSSVAVGNQPMGVCFDGRYLWVANYGTGSVSVVDPTTSSVFATLPSGATPLWCACSYDRVWVTCPGSMNVYVYDKNNVGVFNYYNLSAPAQGIAFDGQNMWIAGGSSNSIFKVRETDGAILQTLAFTTNPYGVVFDGSNVWVTDSTTNIVFKIRTIDGTINPQPFPTCTTPRMPAFDGVHVWIPCEGGGFKKM